MKNLILFLFLICGTSIYSQTTESQFSLNILTPSAEYELALTDHSTIDVDLGIGFGYQESIAGSAFGIFPGFEAQYRYYYNFENRADKNLKTSENSANYITAIASITGGDPLIGNLRYSSDYGILIGPAWGLQRVYDSGFKLNLNLGVGYGFDDNDNSYVAPIFGLQLGFKLGR